jgi:hypothetical protein
MLRHRAWRRCIPALYASALDGSNASLVASGPWPFESSYDAEDCIGAITAKYVFLHVWGGIVRVTLATGESHLVYSYLGSDPTLVLSPGSIAADDDFLYVVDPTAGLVRLSNWRSSSSSGSSRLRVPQDRCKWLIRFHF